MAGVTGPLPTRVPGAGSFCLFEERGEESGSGFLVTFRYRVIPAAAAIREWVSFESTGTPPPNPLAVCLPACLIGSPAAVGMVGQSRGLHRNGGLWIFLLPSFADGRARVLPAAAAAAAASVHLLALNSGCIDEAGNLRDCPDYG